MRIFVHHDEAGTIHSLIGVDAPPGVEAMLAPEPRILVTEVEGVELDFRPEYVEQVQQFIDGHTVDVTQKSPAGIIAKE